MGRIIRWHHKVDLEYLHHICTNFMKYYQIEQHCNASDIQAV